MAKVGVKGADPNPSGPGKRLNRLDSTVSGKLVRGSSVSMLYGSRASMTFRMGKGGFKIPRYQNTYRLQPWKPLKIEEVDKILQDVMALYLTGTRYNPVVCAKLCQDMSAEVQTRIFRKDFDRYKFVVLMSIIQRANQSIHVGLGRLWDTERDSYSSYVFENTDFYAVGTVIAIYYE